MSTRPGHDPDPGWMSTGFRIRSCARETNPMEAPGHNLDDLLGSGLPLRTTATIVYVTLALLALAIPQAAVNRLNDFSPGPLRDNALTVARAVADASHRIRLD